MARIIFDITPPRTDKTKITRILFESEKRKKTIGWKSWILFLTTLIILSIGYFILPEVKISIWPEISDFNFKTSLTVDGKIKDSDVANGKISGEIIRIEKSDAAEFFSSKKILKEEKAKGKIKLTNNSAGAVSFRASTRFVSGSGKTFRSLEKITVPAKKSVEMAIEAIESGESFNIGPDTFSVPGIAGTNLFYNVFGKSSDDMSGGFKGEIMQVSEEDINNAKNVLNEKILKETENDFKNKVPKEYWLVDGAWNKNILETVFSEKPGANVNSFIVTSKAEAAGIIFKKSDSADLVKRFISSQIPPDKKIYEKSVDINYSVEKLDLNLKELLINMNIKSKISSYISEESLKDKIKGKSHYEFANLLNSQTQIKKSEVKFWPFFVNKAPANGDRIKIELRFD